MSKGMVLDLLWGGCDISANENKWQLVQRDAAVGGAMVGPPKRGCLADVELECGMRMRTGPCSHWWENGEVGCCASVLGGKPLPKQNSILKSFRQGARPMGTNSSCKIFSRQTRCWGKQCELLTVCCVSMNGIPALGEWLLKLQPVREGTRALGYALMELLPSKNIFPSFIWWGATRWISKSDGVHFC